MKERIGGLEAFARQKDRRGTINGYNEALQVRILINQIGDESIKNPRKVDELNIALTKATNEYKKDPNSAEKITNFWQAFWNKNGQYFGVEIKVPELAEAALKKHKGLIYVPESLATREDVYSPSKFFPKLHDCYGRNDNPIFQEQPHFGWRYIDMQLNAPYKFRFGLEKLEAFRKSQNAELPSLLEFWTASLFSKRFGQHFLDENDWCFLGTRVQGKPVFVRSDPKGTPLDILMPSKLQIEGDGFGARFSWPIFLGK